MPNSPSDEAFREVLFPGIVRERFPIALVARCGKPGLSIRLFQSRAVYFYLNTHAPMAYNAFNRNDYLRKLSHRERMQMQERLRDLLVWMEEYENKHPLLRSVQESRAYRKMCSESSLISRQLTQHALITRNQLAYLLIDTMELMEMAMEVDPGDDEKYYAYRNLKKSYLRFMKVFRGDFRKN